MRVHARKFARIFQNGSPFAQLVRNSRYQQLAEGIERTDRRELERHQMGFAEWQLLQHGVHCLSVSHIQDEDDARPVSQRIPLVDLAIEIELRGLANFGRQNALNLRHVRAWSEGAAARILVVGVCGIGGLIMVVPF